MGSDNIEWSSLIAAREKIHRRYRKIYDVPLMKRRYGLLKSILKKGTKILDIGAYAKGMKEEIEGLGIEVEYKSMDVDRNISHDFYSLDDVNERFDMVTLFEVMEHVTREEGFIFLKRSGELLKENGLIIVSTPNIFNTPRLFATSDHKTFYMYDELACLVDMAGFDIEGVYRSYNDAFFRYILKVYVLGFLFRLLSLDYAYSIFVVGRKRP